MFRTGLMAGLCLAMGVAPGFAQETRQESIMVTASMIEENAAAIPAISRKVRADFVSVEVSYHSATRDVAQRRAELETMFARLKEAVAKTPGVSLSGGELGYATAPIDTVLFSDVLNTYGEAWSFSLILGVDTQPDETFDQLMERADAFVKGIPAMGRSEAWLGDEQALGARDIDSHRLALLQDISAETSRLQAIFSASELHVGGLESGVVMIPTGPLELQLYVPYTLKIMQLPG